MTFVYVSGKGTDSTEKGRIMWARVKGKTEHDLLMMGFRQAFMFRPGVIIPVKGVEPSNQFYKNAIKYMTWLIKLVKRVSSESVVNTKEIGQAMIAIMTRGYHDQIVRPVDMLTLAKK